MGLLFDEHPLILSPTLAKELGNLNEAVFVQQLHYWLESKKQSGKNFIDGRYWVYNSYEEWVKQFPWLSVPTLRRTVDNLVKKGYVIKGNYNQKKMDHTIWYSLNYEKIMEINKRVKEQKNKEAILALEAAQKEEEQEIAGTLVPQAADRCDQNEHIDVIKSGRSMCSNPADRCDQNDQTNTIDYPLDYPKTTTTDNSGAHSRPLVDVVEVLSAYNRICKSFPEAIGLTPKRNELVHAIFACGFDFTQIQEAFRRAEESDFLTGRVKGADWNRFDFDWLIQPSSIVSLLEGKYDNVAPQKKKRIEKYQASFVKVPDEDVSAQSITEDRVADYPEYLKEALKRHSGNSDNKLQEAQP